MLWKANPKEKSKEIFPELYRIKEKLLVDTIEDKDSLYSILKSEVSISTLSDIVKQINESPEIIRESIVKAQELDKLLKEYGTENVSDLKKLIEELETEDKNI